VEKLQTVDSCIIHDVCMIRGDALRVWPDLYGFTRFVVGEEDEHKEHDKHDEHDTQIEGKHTHTHKIHTDCPCWPDSPTQ
jgi:hypothetical protein